MKGMRWYWLPTIHSLTNDLATPPHSLQVLKVLNLVVCLPPTSENLAGKPEQLSKHRGLLYFSLLSDFQATRSNFFFSKNKQQGGVFKDFCF